MKKRIYLETSVVSYLTSRPSRNLTIASHQRATHRLWSEIASAYDTYVSALVYEEASRGDSSQAKKRLAAIDGIPMLDIDDEVRALAEKIMAEKGVPRDYPEDALHVAVAAINEMDLLVTWNFAHLINPFIRIRIRRIIEREGYRCPEICSPEELLEEEI